MKNLKQNLNKNLKKIFWWILLFVILWWVANAYNIYEIKTTNVLWWKTFIEWASWTPWEVSTNCVESLYWKKKIESTGSANYMIPYWSQSDWDAFLANMPAWLTAWSCLPTCQYDVEFVWWCEYE